MKRLHVVLLLFPLCACSREEGREPGKRESASHQVAKSEASSGKSEPRKVDVDTNSPQETEAFVEFGFLPAMAVDENCISLAFNGEPSRESACVENSLWNPISTMGTTVQLKARPFCNVVRVVLTNRARNMVASTENAAQVRSGVAQPLANFFGLRVSTPSPGTIDVQANDDGDDQEMIDVDFHLIGLTDVDYRIENGEGGCKS